VEKKVSRTAAQELDARLRMLGSVSSARPAPPSRRTTIAPDLGASRLSGGLFLVSPVSVWWGIRVFSDFGRIREASGSGRAGFDCLAPLVPPLRSSLPPAAEEARPTCAARNERPPVIVEKKLWWRGASARIGTVLLPAFFLGTVLLPAYLYY